MAAIEGVSSPDGINSFPDEVMVEIFYQYVQMKGTKDLVTTCTPVCKRWHSLCYVPRLWRRLELFGPTSPGVELAEKNVLSHVRELKLRYVYPQPGLFKHFSGVRKLDIYAKKLQRPVVDEMTASCPKLTNLSLHLNHSCRSPDLPDLLDVFFLSRGPQLKHLHLSTAFYGENPHLFSLVVETCTSLESLSIGEFSSARRASLNLNDMESLNNLKYLYLNQLNVSFSSTPKFKNLREFCAEECFFDNVDVTQVIESSKDLSTFQLYTCFDFNIDGLERLLHHNYATKKLLVDIDCEDVEDLRCPTEKYNDQLWAININCDKYFCDSCRPDFVSKRALSNYRKFLDCRISFEDLCHGIPEEIWLPKTPFYLR